MLLVTLVLVLPVMVRKQAEEHSVFFKIEENYFRSYENTIWTGKADSLLSCSQMCARRADCKSANFIASQETCLLLGEGQVNQEEKLLRRGGLDLVGKGW